MCALGLDGSERCYFPIAENPIAENEG